MNLVSTGDMVHKLGERDAELDHVNHVIIDRGYILTAQDREPITYKFQLAALFG